MTALRIALWTAVSSQAQAQDDKISLQDQEAQGRAFAEAVGGAVVSIYVVPGHSRDLIFYADAEATMPAYRQLRQDVEAGRWDVLWCLDVDRLGRDPALCQQVISLVEKAGAEVYVASAPHQLGQKTAAHRYISAIQSVRAGEDQALRVHRHRSGMKGRIEKRGLLPGVPPFYLDAVRNGSGEVVGYKPNDYAGALALMTDAFLQGHSYAAIKRRLDASRWPPPGRGQTWWVRLVQKTMLADTAAGVVAWGPFSSLSEHLPHLWDEETHQAILRERQRRERVGYTRKGAGPLTRVAYCQRCGGHMVRHRLGRYVYLRCNRHAQKSVYSEYECHPNHIREDAALAEVAAFLRHLTTPAVLDATLDDLAHSTQEQAWRDALGAAEREAAGVENRRRRIGHAFAADDMDAAMYRSLDDELLARQDAAQAEAETLRQRLAALPDASQRRALLADLAERWGEVLEAQAPAAVAVMLQEAGIRAYIENGEVVKLTLG